MSRRPSLAALVVAGLLFAAPAARAAWSPYVTVAAPGSAAQPSGVVSSADEGGRVTAAWISCPGSGSCDVVAATRSAAGAWHDPVVVSAGALDGSPVQLHIASNPAGDVALAWRRCGGTSSFTCTKVQTAILARGDVSWTVHDVASTDVGYAYTEPAVALDDLGLAMVVYGDPSRSNAPLVARTLDEQGAVGDPVEVSGDPVSEGGYASQDSSPSLAVDSSGRFVLAFNRYWPLPTYAQASLCNARAEIRRREVDGSWGPIRDAMACDGGEYNGYPVVERGAQGTATVVFSAQTRDAQGAAHPGEYAATLPAGDGDVAAQKLSDVAASGPEDLWVAGDAAGDAAVVQSTAAPDAQGGYDTTLLVSTLSGGAWHAAEPVDAGSAPSSPYAAVAIDADGTAVLAWSRGAGDGPVHVLRHPAGGAWTSLGDAYDPGDRGGTISRPSIASGRAGDVVASWVWVDPQGSAGNAVEAASYADAAATQPPVADFSFAPDAPSAGQAVTFTATASDPDGGPVGYAWDLDDDGEFGEPGEGTGATATATFAAAGTYTVELRVTDDEQETVTRSHTVHVAAAPPAGGGGGASSPPASPQTPQAPAAPADPLAGSGFVVGSTTDTTGARAMPKVVGRDLDDARAKVTRNLLYAEIADTRRIADASKLPARPGGGKWHVGDVVAQTPAGGRSLTTSASSPAAVTLEYWAGAKSDRKRCAEMRAAVKGDDLQAAIEQLKAAGCGAQDLIVQASHAAADAAAKKADADDDLHVVVPSDPAKNDLVVWRTTGASTTPYAQPGAGDFALTAGSDDIAGVLVESRALAFNPATKRWENVRLSGASVTFDLHETGGTDKRVASNDGYAVAALHPNHPGTIHVLIQYRGTHNQVATGYAAFKVVDRCRQPSFQTATARTFKRIGSGSRCEFVEDKSARATAAGVGDWFAGLTAAFQGLGAGVQRLVSAAGTAAEGVLHATQQAGAFVMAAWNGTTAPLGGLAQVTRSTDKVWFIGANGVVASGGANVVAAGGANVVAAGGLNLLGAAGANVVAAGGGNVVAAGGLNLQAGQGNLIRLPDGNSVVAPGGANVVAAGGLNVVAPGGGNIISDNGLG